MAFAQVRHDETAETKTVLLWESGVPGAQGQTDDDNPSLTIFRTFETKTPGTAVIVVPGGSYGFLASNHEGRQVANWFNSMGVTSFVLKVPSGPPLSSPHRIRRRTTSHSMGKESAGEFGISPNRVGIMGFCRWHLASTADTQFDNEIPALVIQLIA